MGGIHIWHSTTVLVKQEQPIRQTALSPSDTQAAGFEQQSEAISALANTGGITQGLRGTGFAYKHSAMS